MCRFLLVEGWFPLYFTHGFFRQFWHWTLSLIPPAAQCVTTGIIDQTTMGLDGEPHFLMSHSSPSFLNWDGDETTFDSHLITFLSLSPLILASYMYQILELALHSETLNMTLADEFLTKYVQFVYSEPSFSEGTSVFMDHLISCSLIQTNNTQEYSIVCIRSMQNVHVDKKK